MLKKKKKSTPDTSVEKKMPLNRKCLPVMQGSYKLKMSKAVQNSVPETFIVCGQKGRKKVRIVLNVFLKKIHT